ncbi:MAG TPA: hypothetical protein VGS11_07455 [Candidatus Bathyarchaeia archaeon]|nr:hypothetical protein [Candidatus Bathyarchaeia archaeon]
MLVGIDSGSSAHHILSNLASPSMSNMTIQESVTGTEAGKLQTDLREVFTKILSQARRI